jgi:hypothetical protein
MGGPIDLVGHDWGGGHVVNVVMPPPPPVCAATTPVIGRPRPSGGESDRSGHRERLLATARDLLQTGGHPTHHDTHTSVAR